MQIRVKKRTFSGSVCEQEVFTISSRRNFRTAEPTRQRFENEEEREAHRIGISRRKHARNFNANFSPKSLYSTLTLDDENEVHTFDDAKHIRDLYIRRLRYRYPDAVIFTYLGRGRNTNRIHMHMVSNGIPKSSILEQWKYGRIVRVENLREHNFYDGKDYGQDYTGLANYLFGHWTPEQGGHRWTQTRNAVKPDMENATEVKRNYSNTHPPIAPKGYVLVESKCTPYGYMYFKYVVEPQPRKRKNKVLNC